MRLILSRKGFDSTSGGAPSPIFPDGSMIALPIPDRRSPVRYRDLAWRGRNLGEVAEALTRGKLPASAGAHLDPDLRSGLRPRARGWTPLLGQRGAAQGHLRNEGIGPGDLFVFWGAFRPVDDRLRFAGPPLHAVWGWLEVGAVVPVDAIRELPGWRWASAHPHLAYARDASNVLYLAAPALTFGGRVRPGVPGSGTFDHLHPTCRLSAPGSALPGTWRLPAGLFPAGRRPLTYHSRASRWRRSRDHVLLDVVRRGQEFVLDAEAYPEAIAWAEELIGTRAPG